MAEKAIVFIDGAWLYKCRTALFNKLGEENFEIDYAKLPKLLCDDVANSLDEDISLVRTLYFGTIPSSRSGFNTSKQYSFYDFLERSCGYDTSIHEVDVGGDDNRSSSCWVSVSIATNLIYYAALPNVMDVAIILSESPDLAPAIRRARSLGKRIQLVEAGNIGDSLANYMRPLDFPVINFDDHASDIKLVRERMRRVCKQCGNEEETTWAGVDFFCSHCRGRYSRD
jgi:hypothetical protein